MTKLRVIQWATGGVGKAAIEGVWRHPELELVGCRVFSEEKAGRDVADLLDTDIVPSPMGVTATTDVDELLSLDADCVVYAPIVPDDEEVGRILRSGKNVVTPVGWVYPDLTKPKVQAVQQACLDGGVSLHGTGIHPGGITERFPLVWSALSSAITHVRAEEFSDIRTYGAPDVVRHIMGFGVSPEEALEGPMNQMLQAGFKASVRMVTDQLGFAADPALESHQEVAVATQPLDTPVGRIEPGQVAARRFRWQATVDGTPVVTAAVNWLMGEEHLDPAWDFGGKGERFEIEVTGDPDVRLTIHGLQPDTIEEGLRRNPGVVVTAMHCVNAIPDVVAAEPGIRTYLDLPMIVGRAAPDLHTSRAAGA